jgi:hypothetical protein
MEPVMWVRENSLAKWVGHNGDSGFQIIRAVPTGSPQEILPLPVDASNFTEIHKTFEAMSPQQQDEWKNMKAESMAVEQGTDFKLVDSPPGFDWAAPLLKV